MTSWVSVDVSVTPIFGLLDRVRARSLLGVMSLLLKMWEMEFQFEGSITQWREAAREVHESNREKGSNDSHLLVFISRPFEKGLSIQVEKLQ